MASNEEYLDSLLKDINIVPTEETGMGKAMMSEEKLASEKSAAPDEIPDFEEPIEEPFAIEEPVEEEEPITMEEPVEPDEDMAAINALLKSTSNEHSGDEDMLSLLEQATKIDEQQSKEPDKDTSEDFDIFAMDMMEEEPIRIPNEDTATPNNENNTESEEDSSEEIGALLNNTEAPAKKEKKPKREKKEKKEKKVKEPKAGFGSHKKVKEQEKQENEVESLFIDNNEEIPLVKKEKGFFGRIIDTLLEEESEKDTPPEIVELTKDGIETPVSQENLAILDELENEEGNKGKSKKKKGKGKGKGKGANKGEVDEEESKSSKNGKKVKKEKKPKVVRVDTFETEKKLVPKKMAPIFLVAAAILVVVFIASKYIPSFIRKSAATSAFYKGNYQEAYKQLSGEKLSKSEKIIYKKAYMLLRISGKVADYDLFISLGDDMKAVDSLFTGVQIYNDYANNLAKLKIEADFIELLDVEYKKILDIFQNNYHVSEADVQEALTYEDNIVYTKILVSVVEGRGTDIFTIVIPDTDVESNNDLNNLDGLDDVLNGETEAIDSLQDYLDKTEQRSTDSNDSDYRL